MPIIIFNIQAADFDCVYPSSAVPLALLFSTEVETVFMPWLLDEAEKALDKKLLARTILDCELIIQ